MPRLSCPKDESLFELVSIPDEVSLVDKVRLKTHLITCRECQVKASALRDNWENCFTPEPDITNSLMKVYSRLQKDETLILKGWKLCPKRPVAPAMRWLRQGWVVPGTLAAGIAAVLFVLPATRTPLDKPADIAVHNHAATLGPKPPLAQFRVENKNSIKVHYVEPELLQSIEFETTSSAR